jgi:4-amino-4-deoxy-L-arabinose transferase-like glycosyltransferase
MMLWLSREMMIDYWLTAIVAIAFWLLLQTREFSDRRWSIAFGLVAGAGMLTKWTFGFFVILPAVWFARRNWKNATVAAAIATAVTAYWYIPAIPFLRTFLKLNTAGGIFEGDPDRLSAGALVFYLRTLEGYQLFLPLFVAFIAGAVILWKRFDQRWIPVVLWIAGGWAGLLLFQNKDPRYSAPLLPAVALITSLAFDRKAVLTAALFAFLVFQHYLVSFGVRTLPASVVLMRGSAGQLSWDWNIYTQTYFGLWGPPKREDWQIEHVLHTVTTRSDKAPVRLALVPDIPRFDSQAFQFYVELLGLPVQINRVGVFDEKALTANDYVVCAENDSEHEASFAPDPRLTSYVAEHPDLFRIVERFALPNHDVVRLYQVHSK